jgi:hypothetical protein
VLERLLRTAAIVLGVIVVLGWGLFALDEARSASSQSAAEVQGRVASRTVDPSPDQERAREAAHSTPREAIDDANDVVLSPFASIAADSDSKWARRTIPAAIAFVVYTFGLGFLARFARGRA